MKITRTLLGALAGLTLFACSNDDFGTAGNGTNEPADVLIKLNLPNVGAGTRTVAEDFTEANPATGITTLVEISYIKITLKAQEADEPLTVEGAPTDVFNVTGENARRFANVINPESVTVEINTKTGEGFTTTVSQATIEDLNKIAIEDTPMYGESTEFTMGTECLETTVNMQHTMARLEFSGLKHNPEDEEYSAGALAAVFLNTLQLQKDGNVTTYHTTEELETAVGEGASWYDEVNANTFFTEEEPTSYPTDGGCYAYNIYPAVGGQLPIFTLRFDDLVASEGSKEVGTLYAGVSTYRIANTLSADIVADLCGELPEAAGEGYYLVKNFPAGYIYQVRDLEPVGDGSIKYPDPDLGGFCLVATINVIPWTIVEGSVTWK